MYQSKSSLEVAVEAAARVDAILAKKGRIKPNPIASVLAKTNKSSTDLFQTEFDINDVPLTARNLLTKGITQEEINHFSGASISTRGRYVHPEDKGRLPKGERPLYLFIQGPNKQSLDLAIQRIDSLIKEVMEQEKFKMGPPPMLQMQTSLPGLEKVIIGLDHAPPTFDVRSKVLGPGGANLQYISNETGAMVTLRGRTSGYPEPGSGQESPEPLHVCVEHPTIEVLQMARQLAFNLIETIQQEFNQLYPQLQPPQIQPGPQEGAILQPDPLAGVTTSTIQGQPTPVSQLVNMPPPSMGVPPPQLMQQPPPPHLSLPPPGVHIPAQQGPLVPPPQGNPLQQQILQPQQVNVPLTSMPPPTIHQPQMVQLIMSQPGHVISQPPPGTQAQSVPLTQTTVVPALQYIQANGQLMMMQPQVKDGQVQLIPGQQQTTQLQLIPGTQQLVMQQPQQQVQLLLQYQQPGEAGVKGRLGGIQQRLATPLQIQLQPGLQLLQPGQQVQLQLQQPIHQQIVQQAVRALGPQQIIPTRPAGALQHEPPQVQLQLHQIQLDQTKTQAVIMEQKIQQQLHQLQQIHHQQQQPVQLELQQQLSTQQQHPPVQHLIVSQEQALDQQPLPTHQQAPPQQPAQQNLQLHNQQQSPEQQQAIQHQIEQQKNKQQHLQAQQPAPVQAQQPLSNSSPQHQQNHMQQQQQHHHLQHQQQQQQQQVMYQQQQFNQNQQIMHQPPQNLQSSHQIYQQQIANQQQQNNPLHQNHQQQQNQQYQQQQPQQQSPSQNRHAQAMQQAQQSQAHRNQQQPVANNPVQTSQQQHGQKRKHEEEPQPPSNFYQGPPKPVPPPKLPTTTKQPVAGIGSDQKAGASEISYLLPQIQKQLMPPPPPPQSGAPDDWRNNSSDPRRNRGEQASQQADSSGASGQARDRQTFNHYSSKPQMYNAATPFHMHAPPPPPPPPLPNPSAPVMSGQYPFYQGPPHSQYPYFMMQQHQQ